MLINVAIVAAAPIGDIDEIRKFFEANSDSSAAVIVWLKDNEFTSPRYQEDLDKKRAEIRNIQDEALEKLTEDEFAINFRYIATNGIAGMVAKSGFEKLLADSNVDQIFVDRPVELYLSESRPLVKANDVESLGVAGNGMTVCVVDTGINYTHQYLGGCFGPGCKVVMGYDFCNGEGCAGAPDPDPMDEDGHGTHVAGIVASAHSALRGMAPSANLAALKVLNNNGQGTSSAVAAGIDFCVNYAGSFNVRVVTMSLGDRGQYTSSNCPATYNPAIENARNAGIFVDAASGNEGYVSGISYPACAPGVTSVGAVYDADVGSQTWQYVPCTDLITGTDNITCFTNRASNLDLLAPGSIITSTGIQGNFVNISGTSMAAPHIAGIAALLYTINPNLLPFQIENLLKTTGKRVFDQSVSLTFPRVDARVAASVAANPANWVYEKRITFDPSTSVNPSAVADSNGNIHIVWEDYRHGSGEIYYKKLNSLGVNLTADIRLTFNPSLSRNPVIAVDRNNYLHVVWVDNGYIYYKKLNNNGVSTSPDIPVSLSFGINPDIDVDPNNNIHIIWRGGSSYEYTVYYKKLNNNGLNLTSILPVVPNSNDQTSNPSIAVDNVGNVHLMWHVNYYGGSGRNANVYKKLDNNGANLTGSIEIVRGYDTMYALKIAVDGNGIPWAVWSSGSSYSSVSYAKFLSNGTILYSGYLGSGSFPSMSIGVDNKVHVSWQRDVLGPGGCCGQSEIYYARLNSTGFSLIPETRLTFDPSRSSAPSIAIDNEDNAHVVWHDDRDAPSQNPNSWEIYYKRSFTPIVMQGVPNPGGTVTIRLSDPESPSMPYMLVASLGTSPGIRLSDGRVIPLNPDGILLLSLLSPSLMGLINSQGAFSNMGTADVTWNIPSFAPSGLTLYFGFVTIDTQAGEIATISPAMPITLQP